MTIFEKFSGSSKIKLLEEFYKLSSEQKELFKKAYGDNYDLNLLDKLTVEEKRELKNLEEELIRKVINDDDLDTIKPKDDTVNDKRRRVKVKNIFERFPNISKEDILMVIGTLNLRDRSLLKKAYGDNYEETSLYYNLSATEKREVQAIIRNTVMPKLNSRDAKKNSKTTSKRSIADRRRFDNRKSNDGLLTNNTINDMFSKINYVPLSREEEVKMLKKIKMYYYNEASDEMKEKYFDYYASVYPERKIKEKYEKASLEDRKKIIEKAISEAEYYREKFLENNQLLVKSIVFKYSNIVPIEDAMQAGNLGLIRALEVFDFEKGNKFSTYASYWIFQSITRHISKNCSPFKVSIHFSGKISTYNSIEEKLCQKLLRMPTLEEISQASGMPLEVVKIIYDYKVYLSNTISLESKIDEEDKQTYGDFITSRDSDFVDNVDDKIFYKKLKHIINITLDEREKKIIYMRFGLNGFSPKTLDEIGKLLGITRERVRQIEDKALCKLKVDIKIKRYCDSEIQQEDKISELSEAKELIDNCDLKILNEIELNVINLVYGHLYDIKNVSKTLGISELKVVSIQKKALRKLRSYYATSNQKIR